MSAEFPLSVVIKAVDRATAPLRAINKRFAAFTAPVRKLNNSFKALGDEAGIPRLVKGFKGVGAAVGNVGREAAALGLKIAGLAVAAAFALHRIVKGAVDAGDQLGEMAQRVGLSVDAYAQLQHAAAQADVTQEQFNGAMDQFNKRLGEAKAGSGQMLAFLTKVSPALAKQIVGAKSTEEALGFMTAAFERVEDPGKRAALAAAVFGRSGLQMGQFLGQGTKAIEKQRARFLELSGSQEEFAKGAGEVDNAMRESEVAFLGLRNAAAGALFPALTLVFKGIADFLAANRQGIAEWAQRAGEAIRRWVEGGGMERLRDTLIEIKDTVASVVEAIGGLKGIAIVAAAVLGAPFLGAIATLASAFVTLGVAIGATPIGWLLLGIAAISAAVLLVITHMDELKKFFGPGEGGSGAQYLGADAEEVAAAEFVPRTSSAHTQVTVDFANAPKGTRVTADPKGTAALDLSVGYAMVGSH